MADKPLSFKNFTEEDIEIFEDSQTLDEVLSISGRRKKARDAKRRKTMLKLARKRAKRRMARDPVLKKNRLELIQMMCKTFDNYVNFSLINSR